MSQYTRIFCLEVLTPAGQVATAEAVSVVLPAADGEVGILADRAPLITLLGAGLMRVQTPTETREFFVAGGFAHICENGATVLAEECVPLAELSERDAHEELDRAMALPAGDRRTAALNAARKKVAVVTAAAQKKR
jgi:F-type H+-transporting ATPase subunit epsilon